MKKITICALVSATIFFVCTAFFQGYDLAKSIEQGKSVYTSNCTDCHMAGGIDPQDQYPPLAKADYLMKPADSLINIVFHGQTGEIVVNGKKYNDEMLAQDYLTDTQIADVLNFVRNSWGNKFDVITPQQVKSLRK
jgi:nitrite reductase (NO-forming)